MSLDGELTASRTTDGTIVVTDSHGSELSRRAINREAVCVLSPWGARVVARCDASVTVDTETFLRTSPRIVVTHRASFASRDGVTLAHGGPCSLHGGSSVTTTDAPLSGLTACSFTPDRGWREWTAPGDGDLVDMYQRLALITLRPRTDAVEASSESLTDLRLYDLDSARFLPLRLSDPTARWVRAGFSRTGNVIGLARTGTRQSPQVWLVSATPGAPLRARTLPRPFIDFDLADDHRGVYIDCTEAFLSDGDGAWSRIESTPFARTTGCDSLHSQPLRNGQFVQCSGLHCALPNGAFVTVDHRAGLGL